MRRRTEWTPAQSSGPLSIDIVEEEEEKDDDDDDEEEDTVDPCTVLLSVEGH